MTGYTRQSEAQILPGEPIDATPLNNEFDALATAFDGSVGHTHDGTTGNGAKLTLTSIAQIASYKVLGNVSGVLANVSPVDILDEDNMVSNSNTALATQQSIKAYVDGKTPDIATVIHAATAKTTPVDADELGIVDSAAGNVLKKLTFGNLKAWISSVLGPLIAALTAKTTPLDADGIVIVDSAATNAAKFTTFTNLKTFFKTYFDTLYSPIPRTINAQTGTTYTFVLSDSGNLITLNNASAISVTVPPNSSVAFLIGTQIDLFQQGAGQVSIVAGAGVTINSKSSWLKISSRYTSATIVKTATDTWTLVGDLAP